MLWIFQVFALSAGLYGCQVLATNSHIQIFCYNQSPYPPRMLSKDAIGCETKHKRILHTERQVSCPCTFIGSAVLLASGTAY